MYRKIFQFHPSSPRNAGNLPRKTTSRTIRTTKHLRSQNAQRAQRLRLRLRLRGGATKIPKRIRASERSHPENVWGTGRGSNPKRGRMPLILKPLPLQLRLQRARGWRSNAPEHPQISSLKLNMLRFFFRLGQIDVENSNLFPLKKLVFI